LFLYQVITKKEIWGLVAQAQFLRERWGGVDGEACQKEKTATPLTKAQTELVDQWIRQAGGNGGKTAFLTRLAAEGIEETDLQCLFAFETKIAGEDSLPGWALCLQAILAMLPMSLPTEEESSAAGVDASLFLALRPFLLYGEKVWLEMAAVVGDDLGLPIELQAELRDGLARRLACLVEKTCHAELNRRLAVANPLQVILGRPWPADKVAAESRQWAMEMLAGDWVKLLLVYPVLGRRLAVATMDWMHYVSEMLEHLHRDSHKLTASFGFLASLPELSNIETDLSDPHNEGRTVAILTFKTGQKLVYKPRGGGIDRAWQQWVAWIEAAGLPCFPVPALLDGGDHCWIEYVAPQELAAAEEAELYYQRAGVLLALLYALGGNDFHLENIIARGTYPVLVDLETLLVHRFKAFEQRGEELGAVEKARHQLVDSVLHIGLLPVWVTDGRGMAEDISGLSGSGPTGSNLPKWEGKPLVAADYQAQLCQGFEQAYDFLLRHREELLEAKDSPLNFFDNLGLRTLLRPTRVYGELAERLRHPKYLRDGLIYSLELERLAAAYFLQDPGEQLAWRWNCFVSEAEALSRGDVPIFYGQSDALDLWDSAGLVHPKFFQETALGRSRRIILRLGESDLRAQLQLMQAALAMKQHSLAVHGVPVALSSGAEVGTIRPQAPEGAETITAPLLLAEAKAIYQQIMDWRLQTETGDFTWIALQMEPSSRKILLGPINYSLYDGVVGLGVFFAALFRVTRQEEHRQQALATVATWRRTLLDARNPFPVHRLSLGLGNGVAGLVRGLTVMADYLEEEELRHDVRWISGSVRDAQIEQDNQLDVFGGGAGLILALSQLPDAARQGETLTLADKCGRHLLGKRVLTKAGYRAWDNGLGYAPLTGAAHGAAGIANALLQLFRLTGEPAYAAAAQEGIAYENELFDELRGNWPDLRYQDGAGEEAGSKAFMSGWCSGAPGIGLARLAGLPGAGEMAEWLQRDVARALQFVAGPVSPAGDTLCCGKAAMIDFLVAAGQGLRRGDLVEQARAKAGEMIRQRQVAGSYRFTGSEGGVVFNPALFHGLAGIGYALLRCCSPEKVGSLLQ
jgi:lantibiotic modifying enzyme